MHMIPSIDIQFSLQHIIECTPSGNISLQKICKIASTIGVTGHSNKKQRWYTEQICYHDAENVWHASQVDHRTFYFILVQKTRQYLVSEF
jgi:hypothetical protein